MPFFKRRFFEYVLAQMVPSVIFTYLFTHNLIAQTYAACVIVCTVCIVGNMAFQFMCLEDYLYSRESYKEYYRVNLTVFLIYAVVGTLLAYINIEPLYTYLFMPYKLFTFFNVSKVTSNVVINLLMIVLVFLVPSLHPLTYTD